MKTRVITKKSINLNLNEIINIAYISQALRLVFAIVMGLISVLVYAAPTTLNLQTAPLPQALNQLAQAMNVQIVYDTTLVSKKMAPALNGDYTADGALNHLLADTGLQAQKNSVGHYIIAQAKIGETEPIILPPVKVIGAMESDAPENLSYTRSNATSANKTSTPVMQTPISVQTVPRAVLRDQQAVQI